MTAPDLKDIRGPVALPGDPWWLFIIAVVIAAAAGGFLWWQRARRKAAPVPVVPQIPCWERALRALRDLVSDETHAAPAVMKVHYSRLSEIVRQYIEERFNIHAPEMTTEEFMAAAARSAALTQAQRLALAELLNASDMVKFARLQPFPEERVQALRLAETFVRETIPQQKEGA